MLRKNPFNVVSGLTLRARLLFAIASVTISLTLLLAFIITHDLVDGIRERILKNNINDSRTLALSIIEPAVLHDYPTIKQILSRRAAEGDVRVIRYHFREVKIVIELKPIKTIRPEWFANLLAIHAPLHTEEIQSGSVSYGQLEFNADAGNAEDIIWADANIVLLVTVLGLATLMVVVNKLLQSNLQGLSSIRESSTAILQGDYKTSVELSRYAPPELQSTATALNEMRQKLDEAVSNLKSSEERWNFALQGAGDGVWDWNLAAGRIFFSTRWYEIQGFDEGTIGPEVEAWRSLVHPDDFPLAEAALVAHFNGVTSKFSCEHRVRCNNGEYKWILGRGMVVSRDAEGHPLRMIGTHSDITERKLLDLALLAEKEKFRSLMRVSGDGIHITDVNGNIIEVSDKFCKMLGYTHDELIGMNVTCWDAHFSSEKLQTKITENSRVENMFEAVHKRKDGNFIDVEISVKTIEYDGKLVLWNSSRDITERKQAEEKLRTLSVVIEQTLASVVITDANANIQYVNPHFSRVTGYAFDEVRGLNPRILKSSATPEEVYLDLWRALANNHSWRGELINRRKSGEIYHEEAIISPVLNHAGKITHYVAIKFDISERKTMEENLRSQQASMREMLESSPIAVRVAALGGRKVLFANQRYADLINSDRERMIGVDPKPYYANPEDYEEILHTLSVGNSVQNKLIKLNIPGIGAVWTMASYMAINYQGMPAVLGWFFDVTELREAKDIAERTAKLRSEFLANMSHEIRTPMNGIIGLTTLALNQHSSPEIRDYLEKIANSSQSLLGILNDILDFSKLEAGRMSIDHTPFDLDQLLDSLRNLFNGRADAQHLEFRINVNDSTPRNLIGDALRLQQILSNLLGNAIKFTEHGQVTLRVTEKQIQVGRVLLAFEVEDTGIGISQEDMGKLFKPFSQVDGSITRRFGGTGLGLAISQNLLHLMGSEFRVESQPERGTTFGFDLELAIADRGKTKEIRQRSKYEVGELRRNLERASLNLRGARVLVAEDNYINQQVVSEFLKLSGIEVTIANNGQEAFDHFRSGSFDAILMDVHMPVMDGIETTERIRTEMANREIPIIALTADVLQEEKEKCLACGMNDFVTKPVNPEVLIAALSRWVNIQAQMPRMNGFQAARLISEPSPESTSTSNTSVEIIPSEYFPDALLPFNLVEAMERMDSWELVWNVVVGFHESFENSADEFDRLLTADKFDEVLRLAHTIKGIAATLGATALTNATATLEQVLRNSDRSIVEIHPLLDVVKVELAHALAAAARVLR